MEEDDEVADVPMLGPGAFDFGQLGLPHARNFEQPAGIASQQVQSLGAELLQDAAGQDRADTLDQARGKKFLHARGRSRQQGDNGLGLELAAILVVDLPAAGDLEALPRRERGEGADDGQARSVIQDETADGIAVVRVVEGDQLDRSFQALQADAGG